MSHRNFTVFLVALGLASVACSTQSPLAPGTSGDEVPRLSVVAASTWSDECRCVHRIANCEHSNRVI